MTMSRRDRLRDLCVHFGVKPNPSDDPPPMWAMVLSSPSGACAVISDISLTTLVEHGAASVHRRWLPLVIANLDTGRMYRPLVNVVLGAPVASLNEIQMSKIAGGGARQLSMGRCYA